MFVACRLQCLLLFVCCSVMCGLLCVLVCCMALGVCCCLLIGVYCLLVRVFLSFAGYNVLLVAVCVSPDVESVVRCALLVVC